ncbi:MAG: polysaccharide deacetylase family protein [Planctomycetes bacterium]|nr:polysaccharide deacetylase family protein [Planctomycetota bacterium]
MSRKLASLSLDLDNLWSYLKTHGNAGWNEYPSYLDIVVPRVLSVLKERDLKITFFIVGRDASQERHHPVLRQITDAGHEVGSHSFDHEPWLHLYSEQAIEDELARTEDSIEQATGTRPTGFRGPGFSLSPTVLRVLARRGYQYDASTFPTFLGPLARAYYFATAKGLTAAERRQRKRLFGKLSEGLKPISPYTWKTDEGSVLEIPVTTMPLFKIPIHVSYLLYLACYSRRLALFYFRWVLRLCRWTGTEISLLLHPLDFMGSDDTQRLDFFPAMKTPSAGKVALVGEILDLLAKDFNLVPMGQHAEAIAVRRRLPVKLA